MGARAEYNPTMALRELSAEDLSTLDWKDSGESWAQIIADVTCASCGAYQAADSDPTTDKAKAALLCLRLFNHAGWRVDGIDRVLCPQCAAMGGP